MGAHGVLGIASDLAKPAEEGVTASEVEPDILALGLKPCDRAADHTSSPL